jgi:hypothetical protein
MVLNTLKKSLESYINIYFPKKQEKFEDGKTTQTTSYLNMIIMWLVVGFAVYLSFRCNPTFMLGDFLFAFFCAPCYILYRLAYSGLCGLIPK